MWEFSVDITDEHICWTFTTQTNTCWTEFFKMALKHLECHNSDICLGYQIRDETCAITYLVCEYNWTLALHYVRDKIQVLKTLIVTIEL